MAQIKFRSRVEISPFALFFSEKQFARVFLSENGYVPLPPI
jgi:hypothetical protein